MKPEVKRFQNVYHEELTVYADLNNKLITQVAEEVYNKWCVFIGNDDNDFWHDLYGDRL